MLEATFVHHKRASNHVLKHSRKLHRKHTELLTTKAQLFHKGTAHHHLASHTRAIHA
jgi:hypothetical protein